MLQSRQTATDDVFQSTMFPRYFIGTLQRTSHPATMVSHSGWSIPYNVMSSVLLAEAARYAALGDHWNPSTNGGTSATTFDTTYSSLGGGGY